MYSQFNEYNFDSFSWYFTKEDTLKADSIFKKFVKLNDKSKIAFLNKFDASFGGVDDRRLYRVMIYFIAKSYMEVSPSVKKELTKTYLSIPYEERISGPGYFPFVYLYKDKFTKYKIDELLDYAAILNVVMDCFNTNTCQDFEQKYRQTVFKKINER